MLRGFPPAKPAVVPLIDQLLFSLFREDAAEDDAHRAWRSTTGCLIAALLRSGPSPQDEAVVKALSTRLNSFSEILSAELKPSDMDDGLVRKQRALTSGLLSIVDAPLHADAIPSFIQSGVLDPLLAVIARGPLSPSSVEESRNQSLEDSCNVLFKLMETSESELEVLAEALIKRQALAPLIKHLSYICGLEDVPSSDNVPRALFTLANSHEGLLNHLIQEAQNMINSNPNELGPGAAIVLWRLLEYAGENEIEKMDKLSKSKKYVPFFLAASKSDARDGVLNAVGEALAARIGQPGRQLHKGISTPEDIEKFIHLVEYACTESAADISPTIQVLRELVLPSSDDDIGGWIDLEAELQRVNRQFCNLFSEKLKTRWDAAIALAPKDSTQGEDVIIDEPSEEGLAHMMNVKVLSVLVEDQYTTMGLLANGLLEYVQAMVFNSSPLSRRAGIELLSAIVQDPSLSQEFSYVPDIINAFKEPIIHLLDDPRALIRALSLQWLNRAMSYQHLKNDENRYELGMFVLKSVTEDKLLEMLKGTLDEATAAAAMIEAMSRFPTGRETRGRLRQNNELVEALWNCILREEGQVISIMLKRSYTTHHTSSGSRKSRRRH